MSLGTGIADGFRYTPDCSALRARGDAGIDLSYCGGDFSDSGVDGQSRNRSDTRSVRRRRPHVLGPVGVAAW